MKKFAGYTPIFNGGHGAGRTVHVRSSSKEMFQKILKNYRSDYHLTTIFRQIVLLNADASRGSVLNRAGDIRSITSGNITMEYTIFDGVVLIDYIKIVKNQAAVETGLYRVQKGLSGQGSWRTLKEQVVSLDKNNQWKSGNEKAHYVAIAGKFDSVTDAGSALATHVIEAYKKADLITSHDVGDQYSLFWMQKGQHKSAEAAQSVASLMQQSSKNSLNVNWLVHAEGADTFKKAAKILASSPLASAKQQAQNAKAGKLQTTQNVYFSNPNTSNVKALEKLCAESGLNYLDVNTSNRDLRRFSTFKNAGMSIVKSGAPSVAGGTYGLGTLLKSVGAGGADKVINNGVEAFLNGNHYQVAAAVVAAGYIAIGVSKQAKVIGSGIRCTFGKGNQEWYTGNA